MSFKPLPPIRGMSGAGISVADDSASTLSMSTSTSTSTSASKDLARQIWCETQWTNLSIQAKNLGLPKLPYFDPKTMLLSKEVNPRLWKQLVSSQRTCSFVWFCVMEKERKKLWGAMGLLRWLTRGIAEALQYPGRGTGALCNAVDG